ncbi:DUF898 family protein [Gemmobacter denitrificans]|uniref:DUF898 family protein n=1 Tax=Gemmobacter denitrificans TaxID=3123040 RepID=A0ABU8BW63_9RHOB
MTDLNPPSYTAVSYTGTKTEIFRLALVTGLLSIVTLGIYRFWAKTRMRQHIWGATRVGQDGFEYTGTGLEKLIGFLIALVVLAVYLAVVNLGFFALGLRFVSRPTNDAEVVAQLGFIYANLFALLPLIYFAQYRAMRYRLARTRFRGIRFGMESAAAGYVWRALLLTLITALSLGLLYPLMSFRLDKYMTDRAWYGDARFEQSGRWTALYRYMIPFAAGVVVMFGGIALGAITKGGTLVTVLIFTGVATFYFGLIYYPIRAAAYLTSHRVLGGQIRFTANPSVWRIIGILIGGGIAITVIALITFGLPAWLFGQTLRTGGISQLSGPLGFGVALGIYLVGLVFFSALALAWITQPLLCHVLGTITVLNIEATDHIHQRAADKGADAEGFADALDVGAAF